MQYLYCQKIWHWNTSVDDNSISPHNKQFSSMTIIDVPIFSHANNSSGEIWFYDQTMNKNMCMFISKALKKSNLYPELSKSLSCLSDNRSGRCGQCVRPIKHLPDLHIFYNFNWITHILAKSIKWFVYSFKWYLGILKVSTTHFCVTCGNIHTIQ